MSALRGAAVDADGKERGYILSALPALAEDPLGVEDKARLIDELRDDRWTVRKHFVVWKQLHEDLDLELPPASSPPRTPSPTPDVS